MATTAIETADLRDNVLAASSAGRGKLQDGFFSADSTGRAKFATSFVTATLVDKTGAWDFSGSSAFSVPTPTAAGHAVTKSYADQLIQGIKWKDPVRVATAAALATVTPSGTGVGKTLTATANGALTVDGVTVLVADRILVKNQVLSVNNGIYVVTATGSPGAPFVLTRATDLDADNELSAAATFALEGTVNADAAFVNTATGTLTIDSSNLTFVQFTSTASSAPVAGDGISVSGSTVTVRADTTASVQSITVNSGPSPAGVAVKFDSAGAIDATSAGTRVKVSSTGGVQISSNQLAVLLDSAGSLTVGASGIKDNVSASGGLQITSSTLSVKLRTAPGSAGSTFGGIFTDSNGLTAVTDDSTLELSSAQLRMKDAGTTFAKLATAVSDRLGGYDRREEFVGDGSTVNFDLAVADAKQTAAGILVYKNGLLQKPGGGNDYTLSDNGGSGGVDRIVFATAPANPSNIAIVYKRTGNAI